MFFAKIEKCQLFVYEIILELFARSWSPNFPIQFSEIRSSDEGRRHGQGQSGTTQHPAIS